MVTVSGANLASIVGLDPAGARVSETSLTGLLPSPSWAFQKMAIAGHPGLFFVLGGAIFDQAKFNEERVLQPEEDLIRMLLVKVMENGEIQESGFLERDPAGLPVFWGLSIGTGGQLQISAMQTDRVAGSLHRTARITGMSGLAP
jgi:hypothetical protein